MIDLGDWQQDGAELDAIMEAHRGGAFPPGVLDAYIARQRRRHALMQAEIDRVLREPAPKPSTSCSKTRGEGDGVARSWSRTGGIMD